MSDRILPLRPVARTPRAAADARSVEPGPASAAFARLLRGAERYAAPDAFAHGVELRHVRRLVQPIVDEYFAAGADVASSTAGGSAASSALHAANVTVVAVGLAAELGLPRTAVADVGVAALLNGVGRGDGGVNALLASTTWSPLALAIVQAALARSTRREASLVAQLVAAADFYVTSCSRTSPGDGADARAQAFARVQALAHDRWHPAIVPALARAVAPIDPREAEQERPAA